MEVQTPEGGGGVEKQVGGGDEDPQQRPMVPARKGKSCKGCLYYSSLLKANARNPFCIGISRTLQQVPGYIVGESEIEATKEGRSLTDFKYACVGYSVFMNNKDNPSDKQENGAELPFCAGIELLVDRRTSTLDHVPAPIHKKEDVCLVPQGLHLSSLGAPTLCLRSFQTLLLDIKDINLNPFQMVPFVPILDLTNQLT